MQLMRRAALDGVQLDSLDERILIQAIDELDGRNQMTAVSLGGADGSRLTRKHRDYLDVSIRFTINEKSYHPAERDQVLDKVKAWAAKGGTLTVNYKEGKQLRVICAQMPGGGDLASRSPFTITFRAYGVPYWEKTQVTSKALTQGSTGSDTITMPGSAKSLADVTVQNKSGNTLDSITLNINGNEMTFTNLCLANNGTLTIDHVYTGGMMVLRAKIGTTSVLANRTGADDFITKPGSNTISYSTTGNVIVTVSAKGRYL